MQCLATPPQTSSEMVPAWQEAGCQMWNAEIVQWARAYQGPLFHAILCDPPYDLTDDHPQEAALACCRLLFDTYWRDAKKWREEPTPQLDLAGIALDGSALCRRQVAALLTAPELLPQTEPRAQLDLSSQENQDEFLGDYTLDCRDPYESFQHLGVQGVSAQHLPSEIAFSVAPTFLPGKSCPLSRLLLDHFLRQSASAEAVSEDEVTSSFEPPPFEIRLCLPNRGHALHHLTREEGGTPTKSESPAIEPTEAVLQLTPAQSPSAQRALPRLVRLSSPPPPSKFVEALCVRIEGVTAGERGAGAAWFRLWGRRGLTRKVAALFKKEGFMGREWDGTGVAFSRATWRALWDVLHPGACVIAFGGSRTYHRLTLALEEAGFEIRDGAFVWNYAGAMAHGLNVAKEFAENGDAQESQNWEGYNTALKPAWEPIVVARKPLDGTVVHNIRHHGCGAFNIEACRIGLTEGVPQVGTPGWGSARKRLTGAPGQSGPTVERTPPSSRGRWPANAFLSHAPTCRFLGTRQVKGSFVAAPCHNPKIRGHKWGSLQTNRGARGIGDESGKETVDEWQCAPGCPVALLGQQSGSLKSGSSPGFIGQGSGQVYGKFAHKRIGPDNSYGDQGTAARFLFNADWSLDVQERLEGHSGLLYCSKPSPKERNIGTRNGNFHPTVKPLTLLRELAKLQLPPASVEKRRILIPFAGSMSEAIAAKLADWDEIVAVEQDRREGFVQLGRERYIWWSRYEGREVAHVLADKRVPRPDLSQAPEEKRAGAQQIELFSSP